MCHPYSKGVPPSYVTLTRHLTFTLSVEKEQCSEQHGGKDNDLSSLRLTSV